MNNENLITNVVCDITGNTQNPKDPLPLIDTIKGKIVGVYKIVNKINGKYYIGSSTNINQRWYNHRCELRKNRHGNQYLQNAWNKYGESNFEFIIVELTDFNNRLNIEQTYLDICRDNRNISYNIGTDTVGFFKGCHHTSESRIKIGNAHRGMIISEEQKKRQSLLMRGRYIGSKNPMYGKKQSESAKRKMSREDKHIYSFSNIRNNQIFVGTRKEFNLKFNIGLDNICNLLHGKVRCSKGWTI